MKSAKLTPHSDANMRTPSAGKGSGRQPENSATLATSAAATSNAADRRQFLTTTGTLGAGLVLPAANINTALGNSSPSTLTLPSVHHGGTEVLKVGLIGCGGRGTGAASDALNADPYTQITALADLFPDRIPGCLESLEKAFPERVDVPAERQFHGFDAYKQMMESDIDVVLLCTTPHFRPQQIEAAIAAGKHVFCEKPVAVDVPGCKRVLEACRQAKEKSLAVVSGLCWRYDLKVREVIQRIQDGAIGDIVSIQENYLTGTLWHRGRQPEWSEMEYQIRNWLYFTWLSGDHIAEQHIHSLDKALWLNNDAVPLKCVGMGGRQVRTEEKWGNIYDHFACCFEWDNGVKAFTFTRQMAGCANDTDDYVQGSRGKAQILRGTIDSDGENWRYRGRTPSMYVLEHEALYKSIREGNPINDGTYMTHSTLMAIMGREACYTGREITREQLMADETVLGPSSYEFGDVDPGLIAMPGAPGKKIGT